MSGRWAAGGRRAAGWQVAGQWVSSSPGSTSHRCSALYKGLIPHRAATLKSHMSVIPLPVCPKNLPTFMQPPLLFHSVAYLHRQPLKPPPAVAAWAAAPSMRTLPAYTLTCRVLLPAYRLPPAPSPWNFPLLMAAMKVAPALACGNTVVLKVGPGFRVWPRVPMMRVDHTRFAHRISCGAPASLPVCSRPSRHP